MTWFEWYVNNDNANIAFDGERFTILSTSFPNIVQFVEIRPTWFPWNSNGYTLDHIVTAYWYVILPSPVEHPNAGLEVQAIYDPDRGWGVRFQKESPDTTVPFTLEQAPSTYWLAPLAPPT